MKISTRGIVSAMGILVAAAVVMALILPALASTNDYGIATNNMESASTATPAATAAPTATPTPTATSVLDTLGGTPWPTQPTCPSGQIYNSGTGTCVSPLSLPAGNPESQPPNPEG